MICLKSAVSAASAASAAVDSGLSDGLPFESRPEEMRRAGRCGATWLAPFGPASKKPQPWQFVSMAANC